MADPPPRSPRPRIGRLLRPRATVAAVASSPSTLAGVEHACRAWLDRGGHVPGVADQVAEWAARFPDAGTCRFAEVRRALTAGDPGCAHRLLTEWAADSVRPPAVGDARWWAQRLLAEVERGALTRPPSRCSPGTPATLAPAWVRDLVASVLRMSPTAGTTVISVRGGPEAAREVAAEVAGHLARTELRVLRCDLDDPAAAHPLTGWLDVLWDDVQWNLLGDDRLARLAPTIDRQLGRRRPPPRSRSDPVVVDPRRADEVLVEVLHRLHRAQRAPTAVLVRGSPPAQRWLTELVASRPLDGRTHQPIRLAVVDATSSRSSAREERP